MKKLIILFFVIINIASINLINAEEIKDIIRPITVYAGIKDSLIIDDLFYLENYDLKLLPNKDIDASFIKEKHLLYIKAKAGFSGTTFLDFENDGQKYSILLISKLKYPYTFKFKTDSKPKIISVFGNFNGWNRNELIMAEKEDGCYYLTQSFDPGRYEYKYFIDGAEFLDQNNKDSIANGIGGFNSNLIIEDKDASNSYLYIMDKITDDVNLTLNFLYKGENNVKIKTENVFALLGNKQIFDNIEILNNEIKIKLLRKNLLGENVLRIIVNENGKLSNLQTVTLNDGDVRNIDSPFNWYDGIIYSLLTDRFNNGNKNNDNPIVQDSLFYQANYQGGDFKGVIDKIESGYFDKLGINTLWLSPIYDNPNIAFREYPAPYRWFTGYHGYWPISPNQVEEHFGTMDEFKELVRLAHKHGIKVLLDFVSHHVHKDHPYFLNNPEWFGKLVLPDGRLNLRFWDEYRLTTWFEPYLPSFDFLGSPEALEAVSDNAVWWLKETGADGFRHDAVKHVPNEFWRTLTKKLKTQIENERGLKVYQIGETFGSYGLISSYVNNGQLSSQFNFNLFDASIPVFIDSTVSFKRLADELKQTERVYGNPHYMGNIIDSHDKVRFMSYADGDVKSGGENLATELGWNNPPVVDDPKSYDQVPLYLAFMNTIPGLPVLYYGTEWGMTGANDPDNRRMMKFEEDLDKYQLAILEKNRRIVNIRKNSTALKYGDLNILIAEKDLLAYLRTDFNEKILVVLNKGSKDNNRIIELPFVYKLESGIDLIDETTYKVSNGCIGINIPAEGYKIIKLK